MPDDGWEARFRGAVQGIIEGGAQVRASTAELWTEIRGAASEAGVAIGQSGFELVNRMRGEAAARRVGYERFNRAPAGAEFTMAMAAPEANIRPEAARAIQPEYLVRFDLTYLDPLGNETTRTVSLRDVWRPGMTVGDVIDAVGEAAEGLSNEYGQGLVGFSNIRPVTI